MGRHGDEPRKIVTDKLRSYGVAHRELIPETIHSTKQYENNRAEQSHEATRVRERGMRALRLLRECEIYRVDLGRRREHNAAEIIRFLDDRGFGSSGSR